MTRICFVCLGNICRSPTAEAVMRELVERAGRSHEFEIDSAGTGSWHVGSEPDSRAQQAALERGIRLRGVARQFRREDFSRFDHVIAMDRENQRVLERMAPDAAARAKIQLLRSFEPGEGGADVPDPYYEGGFDRVFAICEAACQGLLEGIG